jgi:hypothetical protein
MQNMVKEAEKRTAEYERKEAMVQEDGINTWSDNSRRAYFREFKKVSIALCEARAPGPGPIDGHASTAFVRVVIVGLWSPCLTSWLNAQRGKF